MVDVSNVSSYIKAVVDALLESGIKAQMDAFRSASICRLMCLVVIMHNLRVVGEPCFVTAARLSEGPLPSLNISTNYRLMGSAASPSKGGVKFPLACMPASHTDPVQLIWTAALARF